MMAVADSARLAATSAPHDAAAVVRRVAGYAARALERGSRLPLPLLLDVDVLMHARGSCRPAFRPFDPPDGRGAAYERWLQDYVVMAARYLAIPARRTPGPRSHASDLTPLLSTFFPAERPDRTLLDALRGLATGVGLDDVIGRWSAERSMDGWDLWFPADLDGFHPARTGEGVWTQFAAAKGAAWLDERFDHEAARVFLEAANCDPSPDQRRRIWRLQRRRPLFEPNPLTQSYEEQEPLYGAITLTTLAAGEYGEFKIVNRADERISNPPPVRPPETVHVHLCWAHSYSALEPVHPALAFPETSSDLAGARVTDASLLQGFAALLFDDWRAALVTLDSRLHAHWGRPGPDDDFGPPGPRWKPGRFASRVPPPRAVARFFSRANWIDSDARGLDWTELRASNSWWCLVLLESDLEFFGVQDDGGRTPGLGGLARYRAPAAAIPACVSTVLLLDPRARDGAVYDVGPSVDSGSLRLSPVPSRRTRGGDSLSFEAIRLRALDALLDALEARM